MMDTVPEQQRRQINDALKPVARHGLTLKSIAKAAEAGKATAADLDKAMEALAAIGASIATVKLLLTKTAILTQAHDDLVTSVKAGMVDWPAHSRELSAAIPVGLRSLMDAVRTCLEFTYEGVSDTATSPTDDKLAKDLASNGLRVDGANGTSRQIRHSALPPELDLTSVMGIRGELQPVVPTSVGSASSSSRRNRHRAQAAATSAPASAGPAAAAAMVARPAAATSPSSSSSTSSSTSSARPGSAASSPRVAYNTASIRVAKYTDKFAQHLATFGQHVVAIIRWATKVAEEGVTDQSVLDRGTIEVDQLGVNVGTLVAMSDKPLKAVSRQLGAVREKFAAVAFTVLNPTTEEASLAQDLIETVTALADVVKAMVALNVLASRGSIFQASGSATGTPLPASPSGDKTAGTSGVSKIFRLLVAGDQGVGKTTLIRRIAGEPVGNVLPTAQAIELNVFKLPFGNEVVELQILDTTSDTALWAQGAFDEFFTVVDAVLIVLDVQRLNAHEGVARWVRHLANHPNVYRCSIANKVDALDSSQVKELRAKAHASSNVDRYETSGRTNLGVSVTIHTILRKLPGGEALAMPDY